MRKLLLFVGVFVGAVAYVTASQSVLDSLYSRFTDCGEAGYIKEANAIMAAMGDDYLFTSEMGFSEAHAVLLDKYVDYYRSKGDFASRLPYLKTALYFYTAQNDSMNMARCHHTLGTTYQMLGIYDKAIESYRSSSDLLNAIGGDRSRLRYRYTLNNIAALYYEQNELDKCEALYNECLSLINDGEDETRNEIDRSTYLGNIAMVYNARAERTPYNIAENLNTALKYGQEAVAIAKKYCEGKNEVEIVKREITVARTLMLSGDIKDAEKILAECDTYNERNSLDYQRIQVTGIRAEIEEIKGDISAAEKNYLQVLDYSIQMGLKEMEGQVLLDMYELLKDTKPQKALECYVTRSAIRDSAFNNRQNALISEFEVQYKMQDKEKMLRQQEAEIRQGRLLLWSLIAILLLCIGAALGINHLRLMVTKRNNQLKEANETKDRMISIISHDLKNPALAQRNAIRSLCSTVQSLDQATLNTCLDELLKSSESEVMLLSNLLDWARLQTGKISCNTTDFHLSSVIIDELKTVRKMADNKNIAIETSLSADDGVRADRLMVATIFRNLVTNAIKFSYPDSSISVTTGIDGGKVFCAITDHGSGMSREKADSLFSKAYGSVFAAGSGSGSGSESASVRNATSTGTWDESGTGIGLELCKCFISMNNGSIQVESCEGKGSTFTFYLNHSDS